MSRASDRPSPAPANARRLILETDGAACGNPGPAAIAYVLLDERGREVAAEGRYIGRTTNNEAEYRALIAGLERAVALKAERIDVRLDSQLVALQLSGDFRVRAPHLLPLYQRARALLASFPQATVRFVPRSQNTQADRLANRALDEATRKR